MTEKIMNGAVVALVMGAMLVVNAQANGQPRMPYAFEKFCFPCHRAEIRTGPAAILDMRSKAGNPLHEEYIRSNIRFGFNAMPAFRPSEVNDKAMNEIVSYLKGLAAYRKVHPDYQPEPVQEGRGTK